MAVHGVTKSWPWLSNWATTIGMDAGWESDTTDRLHFHFSLSRVGEGNGNSLQCSFLENPRDGVAWWAAVYGVAQSRTRLKRLSRLLIQTLIRQFSLFPLSHGTCRSTSLSRQVNLTSLQNPKTGNTWFPSWSFQNRFFRMKEWT